jgi:hypothetical protein
MRLIASLLVAGSLAFAAEPEAGFKSLFNGKDLDGWVVVRPRGPGYVVENGVIVCPASGGGNLLSDRDYANFILRLDFKMEPGGNNGVGIRAPLAGDIAYSGFEIQILDHDHPKYAKLQPWQRNGSIYHLFPAKEDALKPAGEWNTYEITANGKLITVKLNGKLITEGDLSKITDPELLKKHTGIQRTTGRVGFLGHGTRVEFRNISIKELP